MSDDYVASGSLELELGGELALYQFGDHAMNHYFCKTCGIFPFGEVAATPGRYRVNLGCVDGVDPFALEIRLSDGASY
jgi:hypothetical protein